MTSVVAGIGNSVASYLEGSVPPPVLKNKKRKRRTVEIYSSSESEESDDEVVSRVYTSVQELNDDTLKRA